MCSHVSCLPVCPELSLGVGKGGGMLLDRVEGSTKTYRARSGVNVCLISLIVLAEEPAAEVPAPLAAQKKMLDEQAIRSH